MPRLNYFQVSASSSFSCPSGNRVFMKKEEKRSQTFFDFFEELRNSFEEISSHKIGQKIGSDLSPLKSSKQIKWTDCHRKTWPGQKIWSTQVETNEREKVEGGEKRWKKIDSSWNSLFFSLRDSRWAPARSNDVNDGDDDVNDDDDGVNFTFFLTQAHSLQRNGGHPLPVELRPKTSFPFNFLQLTCDRKVKRFQLLEKNHFRFWSKVSLEFIASL